MRAISESSLTLIHITSPLGANVDPIADDPSWLLRLNQAIARAGLEYICIQDHPYNAGFLETWTLIAMLLQATQQVHIFLNVANLPLRPPAMLAKAAATLAVRSFGRVELGLGVGTFARSSRPWAGLDAAGASRLRLWRTITLVIPSLYTSTVAASN